MKHLLKFLILASFFLFSMFSLAGCSSNQAKLYDAIFKTASINSAESKSTITLHFKANDLSDPYANDIKIASKYLDNLKLDVTAKESKNADMTIAKAQYDGNLEVGGIGMKGNLWVDYDTTGSTPKINEIFKLPAAALAFLPEGYNDKEYITLDYNKLMNLDTSDEALKLNSKYLQSFYPKLLEMFKNYGGKLSIGDAVVTCKQGTTSSGEAVDVYEIKLDDASLRELLKQFVNSLDENKESTKTFVNDYLTLVASSMTSADSSTPLITKQDIDKVVSDLDTYLPAFKEQFNKFLDSSKDVKLVGEKGIIFDFSVNKDGYIVSQSAAIDLAINLSDVYKLASTITGETLDSEAQPMKGTLQIGLDCVTDLSNINKDVQVTLPELTSQNSFDYVDMINYQKKLYEDQEKQYEQQLAAERARMPITVVINDNYVGFKSDPIEKNGTILVPMRETFTALGSKVAWNAKKQSVTATKGKTKVIIKLKSKTATVNGKSKALSTPAVMIKGSVYVPLRFVSESLGGTVDWDPYYKTVTITSSKK